MYLSRWKILFTLVVVFFQSTAGTLLADDDVSFEEAFELGFNDAPVEREIIHPEWFKESFLDLREDLEDAIAREAAAEREKRARIKLSEAEDLSADAFIAAANKYENNAIGLQLRSMNMLYEICLEGKSTMVFVPTDKGTNGMPSIIGLESYKDLIENQKK